MKRMNVMLVLLALAVLLVGCSKETEPVVTTEAVSEATETVPVTEETEAPTEAPTEPEVYDGVLKCFFDTFYDMGSNPCTLEILDEKTIRANIYQDVMYRKDFVEQIAVGDTIVLPDREILIEKLDSWGNDRDGYIYEINVDSQEYCVRLVQEAFDGDYYLTDKSLWHIYAFAKTVDITAQSGPLSFFDYATNNPELKGQEQSFKKLHKALSNSELEHINIHNTRIALGDKYLYTNIMILNNGA